MSMFGKHYVIERLPNEPDNRYIHRYWFIMRQQPTNILEYNEAVRWSIIDASVKYDKCEYSNKVMDILVRMQIEL